MFDINDKGVLIIKPELLTIEVFRKLYDAYPPDKSRKIFSYIYFRYDFQSPYKRSYEESEIEDKIKQDVFNDLKWTPDADVIAAGEKYDELQQVKSLKTLIAAENALSQLTIYFNNFNLSNIPADKQHVAVNNMMKNLEELDEVIDKISSVRKRVESELFNKKISGKRKLGKRELPKGQRHEAGYI